MDMQAFRATDLQRRLRELLESPEVETTVLMNRGQPKAVLMSAGEFRRLKAAAGERVPTAALPVQSLVLRGPADDPLGYDTADLAAAARLMVADALSGRTAPAVAAERARVVARLGLANDGEDAVPRP